MYTGHDYADIMDHLNKRWDIANITGLGGEAAAAQEYLMKQPARIRKLVAFAEKKAAKKPPAKETFSWIYDRPVDIN